MSTSPVAIFGYNRPDHLERTLNALKNNELATKTSLYIFLDGPKDETDIPKVASALDVANRATGFANSKIIARDNNAGLAMSIINGVSKVLIEHNSIIVLEDDLITSPYFLLYMNTALDKYRDTEQVMSVSAFARKEVVQNLHDADPYDAYFVPRNSSWGWGTWRESWLLADWEVSEYEQFRNNRELRKKFSEVGDDVGLMLDLQQNGLLDSWAIRWTYAHFMNNGVSLVPYYSYVQNIGFDGSGTHCRASKRFLVDLTKAKRNQNLPEQVHIREDTLAAFSMAHRQKLISRIYWYVRLLVRQLGIH